MADALESAAVFDRLYGVEAEAPVEEACAFVAAEALALLTQIPTIPPADEPDEKPQVEEADGLVADAMQEIQTTVTIEAALLYLIGGYTSMPWRSCETYPRLANVNRKRFETPGFTMLRFFASD